MFLQSMRPAAHATRRHTNRKYAREMLKPFEAICLAWRGYSHAKRWRSGSHRESTYSPREYLESTNPLRLYFEGVESGPGIWKWDHYFDVYHRHLAKFRGKEAAVLEIGIYSGGSLKMWREYFGSGCCVYGVDVEKDCMAYENASTRIFIGDQADRNFWAHFREKVPGVDVVIDDGGHQAEQQIVTLEELLTLLRPGGVYICEDVHGTYNRFLFYLDALARNLHEYRRYEEEMGNNERRLTCKPTAFQSDIFSVHTYPFITVIEKREKPLTEFIASKRGSQWQPFLK